MNLINIKALPPIPEKFNWEFAMEGDKFEPMKKPCSDCAIKTGFYTVYADMLKLEPEETQTNVLDRWFCHNNCKKACAGAIEYLKSVK